MGKYIRLHYYFYNYRCSKKELCSILIYTDSIKLVLHSETGSIVTMNNGESINVVETIEEIKNMLNTKQE